MIHKLYEKWNAYLEELVDPKSVDLTSFSIKKHLNPEVWDEEGVMNYEVRERLMDIVSDFFASLGLEIPIVDVVLTGSIANFNWSEHSDIDLHIVVDFSDVDGNRRIVKAWFDQLRINWNKAHKIMIGNHEVEIYVQDEQEPHISSGVYSILDNDWITVPSFSNPDVRWEEVQSKAASIMDLIDHADELTRGEDPEAALTFMDRLKDKLKCFRKCGLERGGEFSIENLAFKALRRNGYLEKLSKMKNQMYDDSMSLEESVFLDEAAKIPEQLPREWFVEVKKKGNKQFNVSLLEQFGDKVEQIPGKEIRRSGITIARLNASECIPAWEVVHSSAPAGWGPMLYDIAMELAGSAGLFADRSTVSKMAQRVWSFYAHEREGEIENFHPIDGFEVSDEFCIEMLNDMFGDEYDFEPSNRIYRRKDGRTPTLDKLKALGKLKTHES